MAEPEAGWSGRVAPQLMGAAGGTVIALSMPVQEGLLDGSGPAAGDLLTMAAIGLAAGPSRAISPHGSPSCCASSPPSPPRRADDPCAPHARTASPPRPRGRAPRTPTPARRGGGTRPVPGGDRPAAAYAPVGIVHTERVQAGPYTITVGFSEWPLRAMRSLDFTFAPDDGIAHKSGTLTIDGPGIDEDDRKTELARHPASGTSGAWTSRPCRKPVRGTSPSTSKATPGPATARCATSAYSTSRARRWPSAGPSAPCRPPRCSRTSPWAGGAANPPARSPNSSEVPATVTLPAAVALPARSREGHRPPAPRPGSAATSWFRNGSGPGGGKPFPRGEVSG
ncbi:hypothetical protein NKH77_46760 [Streptomyces sp. M19]